MKYIVLIVLFISCKSPTLIGGDCVDKLKGELNKNWKFMPDSGYYKSILIDSINNTYKDCLLRLDSTEIIQLFGTPTKTYKNVKNSKEYFLDYALSPPCKAGPKSIKCYTFRFSFDSLNNLQYSAITSQQNVVTFDGPTIIQH